MLSFAGLLGAGLGLILLFGFWAAIHRRRRHWADAYSAGKKAHQHRRHAQAEEHLNDALEEADRARLGLGPRVQTLSLLSGVYQAQDKIGEAEQALCRAVVLCEERPQNEFNPLAS